MKPTSPNAADRRPHGTDERRKHPRVATDWPLQLVLPDGEYTARIRDVSRAGVCFYLDRRIPEMTILGMTIELPKDADGASTGAIQGSGVVVRCSPIGEGVEHFEVAVFLNDMTDSNRERLDEFVSAAMG